MCPLDFHPLSKICWHFSILELHRSTCAIENKFPVVKTGCQPSGQVHQISNPIRKIGMPAAIIMLFIVLFSCYRNLNVGSSALCLPCLDLCICDCVLCLCFYLFCICLMFVFVICTCSRQSFDSFASQSRIALFEISSSHWSASSCCSRSEHRCPTGFWPSGTQRDGILGQSEFILKSYFRM